MVYIIYGALITYIIGEQIAESKRKFKE